MSKQNENVRAEIHLAIQNAMRPFPLVRSVIVMPVIVAREHQKPREPWRVRAIRQWRDYAHTSAR